jgi:hypothetical protein
MEKKEMRRALVGMTELGHKTGLVSPPSCLTFLCEELGSCRSRVLTIRSAEEVCLVAVRWWTLHDCGTLVTVSQRS